MVIGSLIEKMEKEYFIITKLGVNMMENGEKIKNMDMVDTLTQIMIIMKDNGFRIKKVVKEYLFLIKLKQLIEENGRITWLMVREL